MLKLYGYKQCGTCRKAEQFLQQAGIGYEYIDITENPPAAEELAAIVERASVPLNKLFNTSGETEVKPSTSMSSPKAS